MDVTGLELFHVASPKITLTLFAVPLLSYPLKYLTTLELLDLKSNKSITVPENTFEFCAFGNL